VTGFIESPRFPDEIAAWATGGKGFLTTVVQTWGGDEFRNSPWTYGLGLWTWSTNSQEALRSTNPNSAYWFGNMRNLYRIARGRLYAFRFRDYTDYQDEGQGVLGTTGLAVAATLAYQMFKNYAGTPNSYQQIIQKPIGTSIKVYNNGVLQTLTTDYAIDATTGIVTFVSQPTVGHPLAWTGQFDTPARFDFDTPDLGIDSSGAAFNWNALRVVEVRNL
jgi:uncharacterized protein (TIGR02217 family)